jgi:heterodisulfide reductase subunit C
MNNQVDLSLVKELKEYGAVGIEKCFNCGNCTAICPLADTDHPFPRNLIRYSQMGLKKKLLERTDAWQCYYCGDCSETCPKGAEPGETMMAARRWLTAQYDWTGLAKKFYTSTVWEIGSVLLLSAFVVVMFILFHGPIVTSHVALNEFAPAETIEVLDWIMFAGLSFFLLSNIFRMYLNVMHRKGVNAPINLFISEAKVLIYHFATQMRFSKCDEEKPSFWQKIRWRNHMILVSGYVTMLILIVVFLRWFQTDNIYAILHPQRWIGYLATAALLFGAGDAIWGRIKKAHQMHRFSHPSDWMFPILLLAVTLTGILVHTFRYMGLPLATYYTYVIHLAVMFPMLVLEVPFGKWSHLAYRPIAIYFEAVKEKAIAQQIAQEALVPTGSD